MPICEESSVEELSFEVQEIITDVPHWIVRRGISLFFLVLLLFILFAAVISVPTVIKAKGALQNEVPSEEVITSSSGKLTQLFVRQDSKVDSGDILGFIQSSANSSDVLKIGAKIDTLINTLNHGSHLMFDPLDFQNYRHLGELQQSYQEFIQELISFKAFLANGFYEKKSKSIYFEIENIEMQMQQLTNQLDLQESNFQLSRENFEAYEKLYEKKMISAEEFRKSESEYINSQLPIQNTRTSISSNKSLLLQKQTELMELENQIYERKSGVLSKINKFKSEIDLWKRKFVLRANTNGKVVFNNRIYLGQWVEANKPILHVEKEGSNNFFGELNVGQYALGKIKVGQTVLLKVPAYPYVEFGMIRGRIEYIPDITFSDSIYIVRIALPRENLTTYNKRLKFRNGLVIDAEIITEKRTLLNKLFDNLHSVLKNRG